MYGRMYVLYVYLRFGGDQSVQEQSQSKEEPNFALSGKLTAETNTYKVGVVDRNRVEEGCLYSLDWTTGLTQNCIKRLFQPFSV